MNQVKILQAEDVIESKQRMVRYMLSLKEGDNIKYTDGTKAFIQRKSTEPSSCGLIYYMTNIGDNFSQLGESTLNETTKVIIKIPDDFE